MVFVNAAMEIIGAFFGAGDNHGGGRGPVLRIEVGHQHADFADGFRRDRKVIMDSHHPALTQEPFHHADAIEDGFVRIQLAAIEPGLECVGCAAGVDPRQQSHEYRRGSLTPRNLQRESFNFRAGDGPLDFTVLEI